MTGRTMDDRRDNRWDEILHAAREAGVGRAAAAPPAAAPERFVARVRAMRAGLWALAKALFWRRWSLVAVAIAALLYLVVHLLLRPDPPRSIPTPVPPTPLAP